VRRFLSSLLYSPFTPLSLAHPLSSSLPFRFSLEVLRNISMLSLDVPRNLSLFSLDVPRNLFLLSLDVSRNLSLLSLGVQTIFLCFLFMSQ
jgi:hypothetical protein